MKNFLLKLLALIVLVCASTVGLASLAFAHANQIVGTSACQTDGTYTVTWKVSNDYNATETVSFVSKVGGGTLTGLPANIAASPSQPYKFVTVTVTGIAGSATTAGLTVHGVWSDNYSQNDVGSLALAGTCKQHVTANVTFQDPTCANSNTAAVFGDTDTASVDFTRTGTVAPGGHVNVTAVAKAGFVLDGTNHWEHTFTAAADCRPVVTPVPPTVTRTEVCAQLDTFTTGTPNVTYVPASGSLPEGVVTDVTATPNAGYRFDGPQSVVFHLDGSVVEVCPTTTTTPPTTVPPTTTTIPPTTVPPTTEPPTTVPPVTEPPTTVPPVTEAPTTLPEAPATTTTVPFVPVAPEVLQVTELPATGTKSDILWIAFGLIVIGIGFIVAGSRNRKIN